jgi:uncharacterized Zn finger protein
MQPLDNQQLSSSQPSINQPSSNQPAVSPQPAAVPVPFTTFCGLAVLQQVTPERFCKAVNSLADGSLAVTITSQSETAIQATAQTANHKAYEVSLNAAGTACSCPDALFRHSICKHGIALALQLLLVPQQPAEQLAEPPADPQQQPAEPQAAQEAEQPVNLRLGKVRRHFSYPA